MNKTFEGESSLAVNPRAVSKADHHQTMRSRHRTVIARGKRAYQGYWNLKADAVCLGIDGKIGVIAACIESGVCFEAEIIRTVSNVCFSESPSLISYLLKKFRGDDPAEALWSFDPVYGYAIQR